MTKSGSKFTVSFQPFRAPLTALQKGWLKPRVQAGCPAPRRKAEEGDSQARRLYVKNVRTPPYLP
ncbi:hypothetical protein [Paenibacillus sp. HGF7]|uniref:hypothetical protein n=1 Tax=Paenibacillus sp. HGF7 TaxID=944559 RepID=UPI00110FA291|nr:hypothetical protein [Paenibacillus sp. HGF7]